jgi:hypothetical protein
MDAIEEGMEVLREAEVAWLSEALATSIAGLGYPVGCGIEPHPDQVRHAAETIFDRYAKMIDTARRAPWPAVTGDHQ